MIIGFFIDDEPLVRENEYLHMRLRGALEDIRKLRSDRSASLKNSRHVATETIERLQRFTERQADLIESLHAEIIRLNNELSEV